VLLITSEYRYGTIHPTFVFTPRRSRVLSAKLPTGLLTGLVFGVAGVGLALGIGSLILSARGIPSTNLLPPAAGGAALIGWPSALALAGLVLTLRRDVT
jgi:hypothetical protein